MLSSPKLVLGSLSVKVMVVVPLAVTLALEALMLTVGGMVSGVAPAMLRAMLLLASAPSWLKLPAASVNLPLATAIAAELAPVAGVKVAL